MLLLGGARAGPVAPESCPDGVSGDWNTERS